MNGELAAAGLDDSNTHVVSEHHRIDQIGARGALSFGDCYCGMHEGRPRMASDDVRPSTSSPCPAAPFARAACCAGARSRVPRMRDSCRSAQRPGVSRRQVARQAAPAEKALAISSRITCFARSLTSPGIASIEVDAAYCASVRVRLRHDARGRRDALMMFCLSCCSADSARACAISAGLSTFPTWLTGSGSFCNRHRLGTANDAKLDRNCCLELLGSELTLDDDDRHHLLAELGMRNAEHGCLD